MEKYLAFDVGGTDVKYAIVLKDGKILEKGKFTSPKYSFEALIKQMGVTCLELQKKHDVVGIALSVPGAPDDKTGIILGGSALPFIHGPDVRAALLEETGLEMHMENDAKSAALGEVWLGAAKDVDDAVFLVIGTGLGGALVKNKKVHHGINLLSGEFGYIIIGYDFAKEEFKMMADHASTGCIVRDVAISRGVDPAVLDGKEIFAAAEAGDPDCFAAIEAFYESLAVCVYNLMYIYNPECIILGGAISAREDLGDKIEEKLAIIKKNVDMDILEVKPDIVRCQFGGDANLLGAVYNYIQREEAY
ncbi:MAG: ROK family protein [Lachnospiraceae bacterium]|nr:ROK family protein [Lachnospiraceae bacterium]